MSVWLTCVSKMSSVAKVVWCGKRLSVVEEDCHGVEDSHSTEEDAQDPQSKSENIVDHHHKLSTTIKK